MHGLKILTVGSLKIISGRLKKEKVMGKKWLWNPKNIQVVKYRTKELV